MSNPQLVAEMVSTVKARVGTEVCMSVKIRIHRDLKETVEFVRRVEKMGVDFIGVHGRLKNQRSSTSPNLEAIALVKSTVSCPVVANGDVYSLKDVTKIVGATKVDGTFHNCPPVCLTPILVWILEREADGRGHECKGIVGESGLVCWISNYAMGMYRTLCKLFTGVFIKLSYFSASSDRHDWQCIHEERYISKGVWLTVETRELNELRSIVGIIDWLDDYFVLRRKDEEGYGESISVDENRRIVE